MFDVQKDSMIVERAYLLGVRLNGESAADAEDHLAELSELVSTMGVPVVGCEIASLQSPHPRYLIGAGKVDWIQAELERLDADCLIFDEPLSPSQQRNWEKKLEDVCVIDRQEVILDIFAQRAQTREARLQIQLAKLEYSLPRLKRAWTHLERQRNAAGGRGGMGEMQIEIDRRLVRERIGRIKRELRDVRGNRETQRKKRNERPTPVAAIVGYTNAGKSSLLNRLTRAGVLVEDKLFATLDPTTRRVTLPDNQEILLSDTVGFIRKLPHDLVESFKATLEEATQADILVHVVDASHPNAEAQIAATLNVLDELGAKGKPTILALNKIDRMEDMHATISLAAGAEHAVSISAMTGEGLDRLLELLAKLNPDKTRRMILRIPASRWDLVSLAHREGQIFEERHGAEDVWLDVILPERLRHKLESFRREAMPAMHE
ncbi:GTPase HflX [Candidatus Sumerlaeota bacterium]|nr:GTPase HflX [Candidatus Sumerlaeota bacterium]